MKRYRFRLEQVLRVRRVQADLEAGHLGRARRAETEAEATRTDRERAIAERNRPSGPMDVGTLATHRTLWEAELRALARATDQVAAARTETAARRDDYLTASRRVKALDLLDDRRREEHRLDEDRDERGRLDEMVGARFHRRPGDGS